MQSSTHDAYSSGPQVPAGVRTLAVVLLLFGLFAFLGSLFLWGQGFILNLPAAVDLHFPITDLLVNAPASIIAAIGMWRMKPYGYIASQFVAGFYVYASVEIFVTLWQYGADTTGEFLAILIPQVLALTVAIILVTYLWPMRSRFFSSIQ